MAKSLGYGRQVNDVKEEEISKNDFEKDGEISPAFENISFFFHFFAEARLKNQKAKQQNAASRFGVQNRIFSI